LKRLYLKYKIRKLIILFFEFIFLIKTNSKKERIIIAPVFQNRGGVVNHINMIKKYSSLPIEIYPSKQIRKYLLRWKNIIYITVNSLLSKVKKNKTVIHSHVDPWIIQKAHEMQQKGAKWIHTYHSYYFEEDWEQGLVKWQKKINNSLINVAKYADIKISVSRWLQSYLLETHNIKTIYIPNGVDVEECKNANANTFVEKYNIPDFIIFSGNLTDIKNPLMFINLAKNQNKYKFVMIGAGLEKNLIEEKYNIKLPQNVIALGSLNREDALNAVAASKMIVCTSNSEGLPTAIMEAMIMEKTVVAPNSYGCAEVLDYGKYGYLYTPFDLKNLIDTFKKAVNDTTIGKSAKIFAENNYDWKVIAKQIDEQYKKLLKP